MEAGQDREERRARLAEVPEELRAAVMDHVDTVFDLRQTAAEKIRNATTRRANGER